MVDAWRLSGLSKKAWCFQEQISYHTLQYWYKKSRKASGASIPLAGRKVFLPLKVETSSKPCSPIFCELVTPSGKRLLFHQQVDAHWLKTLLN